MRSDLLGDIKNEFLRIQQDYKLMESRKSE